LCGQNFIDGEIDALQNNFEIASVNPLYQMSECLLNNNQEWVIGFQVPFSRGETNYEFYVERHTSTRLETVGPTQKSCSVNLGMYRNILTVKGEDLTINQAFRLRNVVIDEAPLSGEGFASISEWDHNSIEYWVRGELIVSTNTLSYQCGWDTSPVSTEDGKKHMQLTLHYLAGGKNINVGKTCDFTITSQHQMSTQSEGVSMGLTFESWLTQYEPQVEQHGTPHFFFSEDGARVGLEVAFVLTYHNVPKEVSVGPWDSNCVGANTVPSAWEDFFLFDHLSEHCYGPRVVRIQPLHDHFCFGNTCSYVLFVQTTQVPFLDGNVDFSTCVISPTSEYGGGGISFTTFSQHCTGRDTLYACQASSLSQIRNDLGERIIVSVSGIAKKHQLNYEFGLVKSQRTDLQFEELKTLACTHPDPWKNFITGSLVGDTCDDAAPQSIVVEEDAPTCVYAYAKDVELTTSGTKGQTLIIWESIVVRPISSVSGHTLSSFSLKELESTNNIFIDTDDKEADFLDVFELFPRHYQKYGLKTHSSMSGVDGFCWDLQRFLHFYADLTSTQANVPYKLIEIDFTVEYKMNTPSVARRLLSQSPTNTTQHMSVEIQIPERLESMEIYVSVGHTKRSGYYFLTNTNIFIDLALILGTILILYGLYLVLFRKKRHVKSPTTKQTSITRFFKHL
jgi:hypothetical protein